ncbi:hypothetical protein MNBD_CHLOROFLEXI01-3043 [hydrothermal vent metagenome]|uniref:Uncharacterized protein n=1 Tax=hydrothermal vent metagenome TaxID=652676 RepID=A0A3B0VEG4_9ZZZZ
MNEKDFNNLVESIKQAGKIKKEKKRKQTKTSPKGAAGKPEAVRAALGA